ncbi:MAG: hypothetical protein ACFCU1_14480 [Sumerlaeia bacterium]
MKRLAELWIAYSIIGISLILGVVAYDYLSVAKIRVDVYGVVSKIIYSSDDKVLFFLDNGRRDFYRNYPGTFGIIDSNNSNILSQVDDVESMYSGATYLTEISAKPL